jgi:hypothetical protein
VKPQFGIATTTLTEPHFFQNTPPRRQLTPNSSHLSKWYAQSRALSTGFKSRHRATKPPRACPRLDFEVFFACTWHTTHRTTHTNTTIGSRPYQDREEEREGGHRALLPAPDAWYAITKPLNARSANNFQTSRPTSESAMRSLSSPASACATRYAPSHSLKDLGHLGLTADSSDCRLHHSLDEAHPAWSRPRYLLQAPGGGA